MTPFNFNLTKNFTHTYFDKTICFWCLKQKVSPYFVDNTSARSCALIWSCEKCIKNYETAYSDMACHKLSDKDLFTLKILM
mgnify:CR=1 FL=1